MAKIAQIFFMFFMLFLTACGASPLEVSYYVTKGDATQTSACIDTTPENEIRTKCIQHIEVSLEVAKNSYMTIRNSEELCQFEYWTLIDVLEELRDGFPRKREYAQAQESIDRCYRINGP